MKKEKRAAPSFEERMQRLQEIVALLEKGELPLEESVALYKEATACSKDCRLLLEQARNDLRIVQADGTTQPFVLSGDEEASS